MFKLKFPLCLFNNQVVYQYRIMFTLSEYTHHFSNIKFTNTSQIINTNLFNEGRLIISLTVKECGRCIIENL